MLGIPFEELIVAVAKPEDHGLRVYARLRDGNGIEVCVSRSSCATFDGVRIFAVGIPEYPHPTPLLTVEQAKVVRDALDKFIKEHESL